jgi:hypothetical protein
MWSLNDIENASRVGRKCAKPDWIRRFIRSLAEDAKFEEKRESSSNPAADAGFGETRRRRGGEAGGCEYRGDSGIHQPEPKERGSGATRKLKPKAKPEDEARGATRSIIGRRSRIRGVSRETWGSGNGGAEGREIRGNSKIRRRHSRKVSEPGQPGELIGRCHLEERC